MENHYDESYFNWQKNMGAFGGWAELIKFQPSITPEMNVLDFGCGGGFLLKSLVCKDRIGVDINDFARENCEKSGIKAFKYVTDVPDNWADCIVSNHALEHVPDPMSQLLLLKEKLKPGGKIIFVVPSDSLKYKPNDINCHLYSWSPMNLGNFFTAAGFKVIESKAFVHRWPPYYYRIAKVFGSAVFHATSRIYGFLMRHSLTQSRVVAIKE
jgi:SAM-dependent methyltransferase